MGPVRHATAVEEACSVEEPHRTLSRGLSIHKDACTFLLLREKPSIMVQRAQEMTPLPVQEPACSIGRVQYDKPCGLETCSLQSALKTVLENVLIRNSIRMREARQARSRSNQSPRSNHINSNSVSKSTPSALPLRLRCAANPKTNLRNAGRAMALYW